MLRQNVDEINDKIKNNELKFILSRTADGVKVVNTKANIQTSKSIGQNIFNSTYCNFAWYWWGFDANVNVKGTKLLRNEYGYLVVKWGGAYGLLALVPGAGIPAAVAGTATAISLADCIRVCSNGIDSGDGVYVRALGSPENPSIYHLS